MYAVLDPAWKLFGVLSPVDAAVVLVLILSAVLGIDPDTMRLHREDPRTTHHCPGDNVDKIGFIQLVKGYAA